MGWDYVMGVYSRSSTEELPSIIYSVNIPEIQIRYGSVGTKDAFRIYSNLGPCKGMVTRNPTAKIYVGHVTWEEYNAG